MKALLCKNFGLPETLSFEEIAHFEPTDDEIIIKTAACSANFPDALIIQNKYQFKPELPFSPGGEVSGKIIKIGKNVHNFEIGQRVFALCGWGGFAEEVAVNKHKVFAMPSSLDYISAASLMYNFGTSYYALKNRADLQSGETILILGAAGGVGLAAVELAKAMGAKVIAAASTSEKLTVCKQKGADFLINYSEENLKEKISEITQKQGVNVVYDPVGDAYTEPALRSIAWGGRYLVVGFAGGEIPKIPLNLALLKGCAIMGVFWGQFATKQPFNNMANLKELEKWFREGKISPHIYHKYSLENSAMAIRDLMDRKVIGKAIVICDEALCNEIVAKKTEQKKEIINPNKTIFNNFDEVIGAIGQDLGQSNWLTVTQEMIDKFADATLDNQWIHVDTEKAKNTPFGQTIAHGLLTLSLGPKLLGETYEVKNVKMGINYGSDKVRYLQPVLSGSNICMKTKLIAAQPTPNNGIKMIVEAQYFVENNPKPVCVGEFISILYG